MYHLSLSLSLSQMIEIITHMCIRSSCYSLSNVRDLTNTNTNTHSHTGRKENPFFFGFFKCFCAFDLLYMSLAMGVENLWFCLICGWDWEREREIRKRSWSELYIYICIWACIYRFPFLWFSRETATLPIPLLCRSCSSN